MDGKFPVWISFGKGSQKGAVGIDHGNDEHDETRALPQNLVELGWRVTHGVVRPGYSMHVVRADKDQIFGAAMGKDTRQFLRISYPAAVGEWRFRGDGVGGHHGIHVLPLRFIVTGIAV